MFYSEGKGQRVAYDKRGSVIMIAIVHSSIRDPLSNATPSASRAVHTHRSVPVTGAAVGPWWWWWWSGGRAGRSGEVSKRYQLCAQATYPSHTLISCVIVNYKVQCFKDKCIEG